MIDTPPPHSNGPAAEPAPGAAGRISHLVELVESLGEIVAGETELLATRRPRSLADTRSNKEQLTATYEYELRQFKADPGYLELADPVAINRLKGAIETFDEIMRLHARRLVTVKSITEGLIQAIADEVQHKRQPITGYNRKALPGLTHTGGYDVARSAPLTLNQTV